MKIGWKIFRGLAVVLLLAAIVVPALFYIGLSTPWAQHALQRRATTELTRLLGTDVRIGDVTLHPLNRIVITDVSVDDDNGCEALSIDRLSAAFEVLHLVLTGDFMIDYAVVDGLDVRLSRADKDSPLNIQGIIDRLNKPRDDSKKSTIDLRINTATILNSRLSYDVIDAPHAADSVFDPNHIAVNDLRINASFTMTDNGTYRAELRRFALKERSGFELTSLTTSGSFRPHHINTGETVISLPNSELRFGPISYDFMQATPILALGETPIDLSISSGSHVNPYDLRAFVPALARFDRRFDITMRSSATLDSAVINRLTVNDAGGNANIQLAAQATGLKGPRSRMRLSIDDLKVITSGYELASLIPGIKPSAAAPLASLGSIALDITGKADSHEATVNAGLSSSIGRMALSVRGLAADTTFHNITFDGAARLENLNLRRLTSNPDLGTATLTLEFDGSKLRDSLDIGYSIEAERLDFKGYAYKGFAVDGRYDRHSLTAGLTSSDPNVQIDLMAELSGLLGGKSEPKRLQVNGEIANVSPGALQLAKSLEGSHVSALIDADITASGPDDATGNVALSRIKFVKPDGSTFTLKHFDITADPLNRMPQIIVESDILNGKIEGRYSLSGLADTYRRAIGNILPSLVPIPEATRDGGNDFSFDFTIDHAEDAAAFFGLPISPIDAVTISGIISDTQGISNVIVDAPVLLKGHDAIENSTLIVTTNIPDTRGRVYATTQMPTKKGLMTVSALATAAADRIDTHINWMIERHNPVEGELDFTTHIMRDEDERLCAQVDFNPGSITFGDDIWQIKPSHIFYEPDLITVNDFALDAAPQRITIDGSIGRDTTEVLNVGLEKVNLIGIFETLDIDKALIGGQATGNFTATNLFTSTPVLESNDLHVDNIGYNYCTIGDADIRANFDTSDNSFDLHAIISQPDDRKSLIDGKIWPGTESLDITFRANRVPVGFMQPYMNAFAKDISGYASGIAHLFGTFKYVDLEGDILAENLRLRVDFTNTYYSTTDSVHMRPGNIEVPKTVIYDAYGNTAEIEGHVWHKFFKEPSFDFRVTNARNFLSYNTSSRNNPDWYGTIYGNGGATITGDPGVVKIGVDMSTASGSSFTFVLNDRIDADNFSFITFRDRTVTEITDSLLEINYTQRRLDKINRARQENGDDKPSDYEMDLMIDITPDATMTLVMDPVGGDEIKANGNGNLRLTYESVDNDLRMFGTYVLDRGTYNFTLQNIIIKDFTIREGSSITFNGDPYSANLKVEAAYSLNANLSDLDESFLQDTELNRTNVPVHALLKVNGDMRQPDISFDLEFPSLTSDTYRKVKSIISTEEMMNRQIIYLLALNRFYTPDYMASTTKGNELFSVASSTISSQLSSMLGKLSDNWSIAPNLRSDRGDFSDVEVDVMLSSRLLNNRLLFNGNFGYRDKSLNTNQFIGDFDIEYLLNRKGSWRLKAYNRYNDQNYYLRSATTTQGVGIVYKHDFDDMFGWINRYLRKKATDKAASYDDNIINADTTAIHTP